MPGATAPPFRFGVTAHTAVSGDEWRALCRRVEDLGYSSIALPDHFGEQLAPIAALATAASVTTLRVGMLVAANDFRHPVVHAKELATLDLLSDGRVDWGMGAGWLAPEYRAAGIPFEPARTRVDRLAEAVAVMKALFADGEAVFDGAHYRVDALDGQPKPVQRPHPPLLVGGAQRRILTLAGREADVVGIAPVPPDASGPSTRARIEAGVDRQLAWIRAGAGDRYADVELNMVPFPVILDDDPVARSERLGPRLKMTPDAVLAAPHVWVGGVEGICDSLEQRRERWGVSSWTVPVAWVDTAAPIVARLAGR
jgi:probable F420-dependent oxidoreductase